MDKTHMAFRQVENLIKPVEIECSGCNFLPYWVPLGPPDFYQGHLKKYPKSTFPFRKIPLSVFLTCLIQFLKESGAPPHLEAPPFFPQTAPRSNCLWKLEFP